MSYTLICDKRSLGHVNLCNSDGECQDYRKKLPQYCAHISKYAKQGDLDGANIFWLLHHLAKSSKSKAQGVKAVEIASNSEGSVVCSWSVIEPCDNSQYQYNEVEYKAGEVKPVPTITNKIKIKKWIYHPDLPC